MNSECDQVEEQRNKLKQRSPSSLVCVEKITRATSSILPLCSPTEEKVTSHLKCFYMHVCFQQC